MTRKPWVNVAQLAASRNIAACAEKRQTRDNMRVKELRQSLALQPLAGYLGRVLPFAVNLLVELDKIISG